MAVRIAAIGAVDDGKSTLIGRLLADSGHLRKDQLEAIAAASSKRGRHQLDLAFVTDGLKAEREQGITVDVAYRFLDTASNRVIIADCPGHAQYTSNAATGASNADVALVMVDATKGIRPQTKRHLALACLFGVKRVVVAVNKMDLVAWDEEIFASLAEQAAAICRRLGVSDFVAVPVSALNGDNVVKRTEAACFYDGPSVLEALEEPLRSSCQRLGGRMAVQMALHASGQRLYLGRLAGSAFRLGEEVLCLPSGVQTALAVLEGPQGPLDEAEPGTAIAVGLADEVDLQRGDMIVAASHLPEVADRFDAVVAWFGETPLVAGTRLRLKHTTRAMPAIVADIKFRLDLDSLELVAKEPLELARHELGIASLELSKPIFYDTYSFCRETGSFILLDAKTRNTVGAGLLGRDLVFSS
jgi:sulfate adenylyltransferase large subunit